MKWEEERPLHYSMTPETGIVNIYKETFETMNYFIDNDTVEMHWIFKTEKKKPN